MNRATSIAKRILMCATLMCATFAAAAVAHAGAPLLPGVSVLDVGSLGNAQPTAPIQLGLFFADVGSLDRSGPPVSFGVVLGPSDPTCSGDCPGDLAPEDAVSGVSPPLANVTGWTQPLGLRFALRW